MQPQPGVAKRSFFVRTNDVAARDLSARLARYARAVIRRWCAAGVMLADDPRVLRAWRRKWDAAHFIPLQRWHDEGFRPEVVYDVGANEGIWAQMCQAIFAPVDCLLFEPQRAVGQRALSRQPPGGGRWQLMPVALGDHEETQLLHVTRNPAASSLLAPLTKESERITAIQQVAEEKVQVIPLDVLATKQRLPKPDLVKIDVQGFEGRVLAGGQETFRSARRMVIEVSLHPLYDGQSLMPEVLATVAEWGFQLDDVQETFRQWPGPLRQVDLWLRRDQ